MSTTIPVKAETKEKLERMKGSKTWDEFLEELAESIRSEKRMRHRKKMGRLLEMDFDEVRVKKWAREYS